MKKPTMKFSGKPKTSRSLRRALFPLMILVSGYYPTTCQDLPPYDCDPCQVQEYGRIRAAGFIASTFSFNDPTNAVEWQNGISANQIKVIPYTHGELAEPTIKTGPGFGDNFEELLGYEFNAMFYDKNFVSNTAFYNQLAGQTGWYFFYQTSSHIFITPVTVTIVPSYTVPDDMQTKVVWKISVKWISQPGQFPVPYTTPEGIFQSCFETA